MQCPCRTDVSGLPVQRRIVLRRIKCKYLVKFQTFCKIKGRDSQPLFEVGAVTVYHRKTILCIHAKLFHPLFQISGTFLCTLLCHLDHSGRLKLFQTQFLKNGFQCRLSV